MDSPPPPETAESITAAPAPESTTSSPPSPANESSTPPPSGDSSSPPPSENSSSPPPKEETSTPPPSASLPPASPPPTQESSPPPSGESPPPNDSSQSPPPSENASPSPPSENASPSPPSENNPKPPTPYSSDNNSNNNGPPSIFSPPSPSSGSSQMPPPSKLSPSPHPPRRVSPSSDGGSSSSSSGNSNSSDSSPNVAIIAGMAVAGVLILSLIILVVMCSRKKKRKPYYMDPGRGPPPGGDYYHGKPGNPWHSPQPKDHVVKFPPPPGGGVMGTPIGGGGGGWGPPPPPRNVSGEYSSGFSNQPHGPLPPPSPLVGGNMGLGFSKSQFSYEDLAAATSGFAQANILGQGGFGYVHKGVLPNGQVVAVKSLKSGSGQGEREFQAEVEIISRVHHRHLVSLVGYCISDSQRMLVYEFVPNSTLEFHLHGKGGPVMDFTSRMRIARGSAKGLAYLHEDCHPRIIHRDIKAANILLDDNYEAMVADFGLAKLSSDNFTHVSTRVMGTFGYLAPEYASSGKLSEKSDVFSFGVMLLELITGRRPVDPTSRYMEDSLVDWARPLIQKAIEDGDYSELADPDLEGNFPPNEMARLVTCASASVRHSARRRPKMSQIVRALEGDASLDDLTENGAKPGQSSTYSSNQSADRSYDTCAYNADMMKFRKMVMDDSQDFNSSQYGATSEYGLNPSSSSSESGNSGPQKQKM